MKIPIGMSLSLCVAVVSLATVMAVLQKWVPLTSEPLTMLLLGGALTAVASAVRQQRRIKMRAESLHQTSS